MIKLVFGDYAHHQVIDNRMRSLGCVVFLCCFLLNDLALVLSSTYWLPMLSRNHFDYVNIPAASRESGEVEMRKKRIQSYMMPKTEVGDSGATIKLIGSDVPLSLSFGDDSNSVTLRRDPKSGTFVLKCGEIPAMNISTSSGDIGFQRNVEFSGPVSLPSGSIRGMDLRLGSVTSSRLAVSSVGTPHLQEGSVTMLKIGSGEVSTTNLADGCVSERKVADNSITGMKIKTGEVNSSHLATNAVTNTKIANGAVTGMKLGALSVNEWKMVDGAITSNKIANGAIDTNHIANSAITSDQIASVTIDSMHLANDSVTTEKIADGAVTRSKIAAGAINNPLLANDSITTSTIADGAVTETKMDAETRWRLKMLEEEISGLKLEFGRLNSTVSTMSLTMEQHDGRLSAEEKRSFELNSTLTMHSSELISHEERLNRDEYHLRRMNDTIIQQEHNISEVKSRVMMLEVKQGEISLSLDSEIARVTILNTSLDQQQSMIVSLEEEYDQMNQTLSGQQEEIVRELECTKKNLSEAVVRMSSVERSLTSMNTSIKDISETVDAHQDRISTAETDIISLNVTSRTEYGIINKGIVDLEASNTLLNISLSSVERVARENADATRSQSSELGEHNSTLSIHSMDLDDVGVEVSKLRQYLSSSKEFSLFEPCSSLVLAAHEWEYFQINGDSYLAAAVFNNGTTHDTESIIFRWNGGTFTEYQYIPTHGAVCSKCFELDGQAYIGVCNHRTDDDFIIKSVIYRWDGVEFIPFQYIPTSGAHDMEFFMIDGIAYLFVANCREEVEWNINSYVMRWNGSAFENYQAILTHGIIDIESFSIDGATYLAIANGKSSGYYSEVLKWSGTAFQSIQTFSTSSAMTWKFFEIDDTAYIALADSGKATIYRWEEGEFIETQAFSRPNIGIRGIEWFAVGGVNFLAVSGYFDYGTWTSIVDSILYKWTGIAFESFQAIQMDQANAFEFFEINGVSFLAVGHSGGPVLFTDDVLSNW